MVAHSSTPIPHSAAQPQRAPLMRTSAALFGGAGVCVTLFLTLAIMVGSHPGPFGADTGVMDFFARVRNSVLTVAAQIVSVATDPAATAATVLVVAGWLLLRAKDRVSAAFLVCAALGAAVALEAAKIAVGRPRPPLPLQLILETNYSFPSGHVTGVVAVFGAMAVVAHVHGARASVVFPLWAALVIAVMLDRLYLGVHWFSDVVGGLLLGAAILLLAISVRRLVEGCHSSP